jgi:hypothetical protein
MKHIKVFEKFGEIDELFLGVNIRKGDLENSIHDALIELVDNKFDIEVDFDDNLGIKVDISNNEFNTFEIDEVTDQIDVLIDYIEEIFGKISVEYLINSRLFNLNGKYNTIHDFIDKRDKELANRLDFANPNIKKIILISVRFKKK